MAAVLKFGGTIMADVTSIFEKLPSASAEVKDVTLLTNHDLSVPKF